MLSTDGAARLRRKRYRLIRRRGGLRFEVEGAHVARTKDGDRTTVEGTDAPDPEALGGGHENGVREARPMFVRLVEEHRGTLEVAIRRVRQSKASVEKRTHQGQRCIEPEVTGKDVIRLGQAECGEQERLVDAAEPGHGRPMVQVGRVRGGHDETWIEQDGHERVDAYRSRSGRPASRRAMERASRDSRPWLLRPTATNGRSTESS